VAGSWQRRENLDASVALRSMERSVHERFRGYERSVQLADAVSRHVSTWESFHRWSIGIQLVRAADSIGANIAEGFGRSRGADRRRMFLIARRSIHETRHWLRLAHDRGLLDSTSLDTALVEIAKLTNGLIRTERA
jgi:four helix bundle protein